MILFVLQCYLLKLSLAIYYLFNFQTVLEESLKNSGQQPNNIFHIMSPWETKSLQSDRTFIPKFFTQQIRVFNFLLSVLRRKKMSTRRNILKHFDSKISMYLILTCLMDLSSTSGPLRAELDFSVAVHRLVMVWFWSLTLLFFCGKQSDHTVFPLMIFPSHRCYLESVCLLELHPKTK